MIRKIKKKDDNMIELIPDTPETRYTMNKLAREKMKEKILIDIKLDLQICEIEDWDKKEYIEELKKLINSFDI